MKTTGFLIALLLGVSVAFLVMFFFGGQTETRYVVMGKLFEEYSGKKDFENQLENFEKASNDSLQNFNNLITLKEVQGSSNEEIALLKRQLLQAQESLSEKYQIKQQEFDEAIWKVINQKLEAFGKENEYDFVLGANGTGAIMYANTELDVTDQAINYLNK